MEMDRFSFERSTKEELRTEKERHRLWVLDMHNRINQLADAEPLDIPDTLASPSLTATDSRAGPREHSPSQSEAQTITSDPSRELPPTPTLSFLDRSERPTLPGISHFEPFSPSPSPQRQSSPTEADRRLFDDPNSGWNSAPLPWLDPHAISLTPQRKLSLESQHENPNTDNRDSHRSISEDTSYFSLDHYGSEKQYSEALPTQTHSQVRERALTPSPALVYTSPPTPLHQSRERTLTLGPPPAKTSPPTLFHQSHERDLTPPLANTSPPTSLHQSHERAVIADPPPADTSLLGYPPLPRWTCINQYFPTTKTTSQPSIDMTSEKDDSGGSLPTPMNQPRPHTPTSAETPQSEEQSPTPVKREATGRRAKKEKNTKSTPSKKKKQAPIDKTEPAPSKETDTPRGSQPSHLAMQLAKQHGWSPSSKLMEVIYTLAGLQSTDKKVNRHGCEPLAYLQHYPIIWDNGFLYLGTHTYHGRPKQDVWYTPRCQIDSKWRGWLYHEASPSADSYSCSDSALKRDEYYRPFQELFGHVMDETNDHQREAMSLLLGATWQIARFGEAQVSPSSPSGDTRRDTENWTPPSRRGYAPAHRWREETFSR